MDVPVEVVAELGKATVTGKELLNLTAGDVIQLDACSKEQLRVKVGGITKFMGYPGFYRGSQAVQVISACERRY